MKFESARPTSAPDGLLPQGFSDLFAALGLAPSVAFLVVLIAGALLVYFLGLSKHVRRPFARRRFAPIRPRKPYANPATRFPAQAAQDLADPAEQMKAIAKCEFETTRLLNREEARLLPLLETLVRTAGRGHRVMAQTSMGEVLAPRKGSGTEAQIKAAFASINSKRLDFLIIDRSGRMVCAIEYQGSGHYQGTAFFRDAVKKEVLRRAGVPLIEVQRNFSTVDVETSVRRILRPEAPGSQHGHTTVHV